MYPFENISYKFCPLWVSFLTNLAPFIGFSCKSLHWLWVTISGNRSTCLKRVSCAPPSDITVTSENNIRTNLNLKWTVYMLFSIGTILPGSGLGIPTDRDQWSCVFLSDPKQYFATDREPKKILSETRTLEKPPLMI